MEEALASHGLEIEGRGVFGGSSFWMRAPDGIDTKVLDNRLRAKSVVIEPGHSFFHARTPPSHFYRLAYSSIPSERIPMGIAQLAGELQAMNEA
jgi:GntR family transcriptional regulator/MocR family aminotransferase